MLRTITLFSILFSINCFSQNQWFTRESENFVYIYRAQHSHLIDHINKSAEASYNKLSNLLGITSSEKIYLNTYDNVDYGFAAATTVPENFIRLEIEPLEPGYEAIPYNDRITWLLNHELVHILMNDQASSTEKLFRKLFSKVPPQKTHPQTTIYSLMTNFSRYTPRWHQEGIAVFLETWLNGGYGRTLGSFDEMFFRTIVADSLVFPTPGELETIESVKNFQLSKQFYIYGQRFCTYLAQKYSPQKLIEWYLISDSSSFMNFNNKFEYIFGLKFSDGWKDFVNHETSFQKENLRLLNNSQQSEYIEINKNCYGWVTKPLIISENEIFFGYHRPHELAAAQILRLDNGKSEYLFSLPTPSLTQVASVTFSNNHQKVFYTTKNNQLFRDIYCYSLTTKESKKLIGKSRIGDLEFDNVSNELWGIRHSQGLSRLVRIQEPFVEFEEMVIFDYGDEVFNISIDPGGNKLAAILHRRDGAQKLIATNLDSVKIKGKFSFQTLYEVGSPENPSWSANGEKVFFNSYVNGVSNIFSVDIKSLKVEALSNTIYGLFRPIQFHTDSLFAFRYSYEGFIPVKIPISESEHIPAIKYFGDKIIENYPELKHYTVNLDKFEYTKDTSLQKYSAIKNLGLLTLAPLVTGFQKEIVLGIYSRFADPLYQHDLTLEVGFSPFDKHSGSPLWHVKTIYKYENEWQLSWDYNAPDFYDIFNKRKRGLNGQKITIGHKKYLKYDNPEKITQNSELSLYTGMESINDNLVPVSESDFFIAQTITNYKNLRRSIGSSDFEKGNTFELELRGFGVTEGGFAWSGHIIGEWVNYNTWLTNHNIFRFGLSGGYHKDNKRILQSRFYFGGFGNRFLENVPVKQYRDKFRFPGIPIYKVDATEFIKISLENNFPPIRVSGLKVSQHFLSYIEFSTYSHSIFVGLDDNIRYAINFGGQVNLILKHWYNLESTISFGVANAWSDSNSEFEWFLSFKLFK